MISSAEDDLDRRSRRTRKAVFDALARLISTSRYDVIRTSCIIESAGIGRSTFYQHFRSKDEVLIGIIEPVFSPFALAAAGRGNVEALERTLEHIWMRRAAARTMLKPPLLEKLQDKLARMIETHTCPGGQRARTDFHAVGAASAQLAMLKLWLSGETCYSPGALAQQFARWPIVGRGCCEAESVPTGGGARRP